MSFNRWPVVLIYAAHLNRLVRKPDAGLFFNAGSNRDHFSTKQNLDTDLPSCVADWSCCHPVDLPSKPIRLLLHELLGCNGRATAGNRDSCGAIRTETEDVTLGTRIVDEQEWNAYVVHLHGGCGGLLLWLHVFEQQLHRRIQKHWREVWQ